MNNLIRIGRQKDHDSDFHGKVNKGTGSERRQSVGNWIKRIQIIFFLLLIAYTAALMSTDLLLGQDQVRGFFSDIVTGTDYPLPVRSFFGINTTLSVVMLSCCSLLFFVCIGCSNSHGVDRKALFFQCSQVLFFLYLTADERLLIHEKMASVLEVNDILFILGLGLTELLLLFSAGEVVKQPWKLKGWLIPACAFYATMALVDGCFPQRMPGRLALEDLSKIWTAFFLLIYAWQYTINWISCSWRKACDAN